MVLGFLSFFQKKLPVYDFGDKKKSLLRKINFFSHLILSFFVFFDRFDGPQEYHYMKFLQHAIQKSAPFMPDAFFRNV